MRGTSVLLCNYIWCPWACIVCIANGNQGAGPRRQFYIMGTIWISLLLLDLPFSILCDLARMCGAYWVIELPISSLFFKTQHRGNGSIGKEQTLEILLHLVFMAATSGVH